MKIVFAGCRDKLPVFNEVAQAFYAAARDLEGATTIIHGACPTGVDSVVELWAKHSGFQVQRFPADWDKHGRAAGPIRNKEMAKEGDILVAFWDGKSAGTRNMIEEMTKAGKRVNIWPLGGHSGSSDY